ncbi:glycine--tRNA ligase subunit beta [Stakelama tenebrarum]|uniref:glycine--tRNA ligase subunit beta n=1 Tax=Stakelama tenebrarum TaxID=2711215 RepID=UPI001D18FA72|nr:glycine--tRNA ligase subunit beta [Sphingosinithalassobacter tenebrarum]
MSDFLLEIRCEEIPARMQAKAREDLVKLLGAELEKAGLKAGEATTYATPRRLALILRALPEATEAVSEELKGPPEGAPDAAIDGFCRKAGLTRDQLELREVKGRNTWFAVIDKPGRATADVLAEAIPAVIRAFPWPKSMRWGDASLSTESLRWVRPLHGIVALLGDDVVPFEVAGVASGAATLGHRFHHPGEITIGSAADYVEKLRACHVIVDQDERAATIALGAKMAAKQANLELVEDTGLLAENAGLTEYPVPLLGSFDPRLLAAPREILELTLKVNQKYFSVRDAEGNMAPNFVCVANIDAADGGERIVAGNRKVAEARLSDAIFFWEQDLKVKLEDQAKKLDRIVFHEKLGTVADKAQRIAKLARWLVEEGIVHSSPSSLGEGDQPQAGGGARSEAEGSAADVVQHPSTTGSAGGPPPRDKLGEEFADMAQQAGLLCKADLVTQTVGEFPEVQGIIGYELAKAEGLPVEVAEAIRDHYKPVGQGDDVPTAPVSVAVALADKLDTLVSFFAIDQKPTGSKDPFALRRAVISVVTLLHANKLRLAMCDIISELYDLISDQISKGPDRINIRYSEGEVHANYGNIDTPRFIFRKLFETSTPGSRLGFDSQGRETKILKVGDDEVVVFAEPIYTLTSKRELFGSLLDFFADRLKVQQREAGVRHDLIDAVFALGGEDDLVRLLARVKALQAFVETDEGANLLAGYKRAANILKKEGWGETTPLPQAGGAGGGLPASSGGAGADSASPPPTPPASGRGELGSPPEPAEAALIAALDEAEPQAEKAVADEDFEGAMAALASLRAPIDAFFESVTVNDADPAKRAARLDLLARMRNAVHRVADFSRIEG